MNACLAVGVKTTGKDLVHLKLHKCSTLHITLAFCIHKDPQESFFVVSGENFQYLWIVSRDGCSVAIGKFVESESIPAFELIFVSQHVIFMRNIINRVNFRVKFYLSKTTQSRFYLRLKERFGL